MCMIAVRSLNEHGRGANIPNKVIDTAMSRHRDGFGIAWRDDLGLRYEKFGPNETGAFRKLLKLVDKERDIEYVVHFRYATQGPPCRDLSHPYSYIDPVVGEVLVFHNGVIDIAANSNESDTEVFVRDVLAKLPSGWWREDVYRKLVDMASGWSRIVVMTADETVNLNFDQGEVDGGIWYSSSHRPTQWTVGSSGKGYTSLDSVKDYIDYDEEYMKDWHYDKQSGAWVKDKYEDTEAKYKAAEDEYESIGKHDTQIRVLMPPGTTQPMANTALWQNQGHVLSPLQKFDFTKDGDYPNAILCDECTTHGDVYIVAGKAYVDINHKWPVGDEDVDDGEALLADEMEYLLPDDGGKREALVGVTTGGKVVALR